MNNDYKTGPKVGSQILEQMTYNEQSKSKKNIQVIPVPDNVIADASTEQLVGKGNLCRILGTAAGYVHFGVTGLGIPAIGTVTAIETTAAWFFTIATDDYIRTSATMRIEVTNEK